MAGFTSRHHCQFNGPTPEGIRDARYSFRGPWALLQWADQADEIRDEANGKQTLTYLMGKDRVELEVSGLTHGGETISDLLRDFKCPSVNDMNGIW